MSLLSATKFGIRNVDDGLHYSSILSTKKEWEDVVGVGHENEYGPLHIWMKCVDHTLRAYYYLESLNDQIYMMYSEERSALYTKTIKLRHNGNVITSSRFTGAGGQFFLNISSNILDGEMSVVYITVDGWLRYAKFPLNLCSISQSSMKHFSKIVNSSSQLSSVGSTTSSSSFRSIFFSTSTSTQPVYILSTYIMDESLVTNHKHPPDMKEMVHSIAKHMLYHKCMLNITKYEVCVQREQIVEFLKNKQIFEAYISGLLEFTIKTDKPPQVQGKVYKWQAIYMNLAVLHHWDGNKLSNKRLLLWDPDEYLNIEPMMMMAFNQKLIEYDVVNFQRKSVICADCEAHSTENNIVFSNHKYKISHSHHLATKISINPENAGCIHIHFARCMIKDKQIRLDSRIAYIVHFENLHQNRIDFNSTILNSDNSEENNKMKKEFQFIDINLVDRMKTCEQRQSVNWTVAIAQENFHLLTRKSLLSFTRDATVAHYIRYEIETLIFILVLLIYLLFRGVKHLCYYYKK